MGEGEMKFRCVAMLCFFILVAFLIVKLLALASDIMDDECYRKYSSTYDACLISSDASIKDCDEAGMRAQEVCYAEYRNREKVK